MWEQTAAQAIGNIVPVAAPYGHGMISYLKSKCDYVRNLSKNFDKLKTEEIRLCEIEAGVKNEKMRNPTMEMTRQCCRWLTEVQTMKGQIQDLRNRYDNTRIRLCGFYPFRSLLKLGKDIVTMTDEVIRLREEEKKITRMEPRPYVSVIKKLPMKINDMPSLDEHVERLIMCLKNDKLKTIGVFGLPGMGKTMVMEHLNDRVGELFEIVFYVTLPVPEMEIVKGIQKKIVEQLNLQVQDHLSSSMMADIISKALADKKYLLLLDQVSSKINLKEVGIHVDNHNHGRVVFACRDRSFCEFTDEEIEIKGLSEVDAKKLFREIVGDIIDQRKYKVIGKKLLDFCSGVPHLIKLIAGRLKNVEDYGTWKSVLNRMRTPSKKVLENMVEFYKAVELIYDSLSKDRQPCLLHWAIFPPDSELYLEYLIECWIGERLIAKNAKKLRPARDEGHEIVTEFESKYLVERCRKAGHFKMPQFLQQISLKLAYNRENNSKFLVAKGDIEEQQWEDVKRVSLIHQMSLPDTPACSEISTLLLQKSPSLTNIPDSFFKYMRELCVLGLYDTSIKSLPKSISSLINLRVLYLNNCVQLEGLPSQFGELKSLEILDLRGTGILSLPIVLAQMTGLKCLRVSFKKQNSGCTNHINGQQPEMIPSKVIEELSSLQELSINVDFKNQFWNQIVDRVATEVATLKELTSLCFYFPTLGCFQTFIEKCMSERKSKRRGGNCLKSFRIQVGNHKAENFLQFDFFGYTDERHLRISGGEVSSVGLSKLFNQVTALEFIGNDSKNISKFSAEDLNLVQDCTIKECNEMESVIDGTITTVVAFKFLLNLHLINLPKLVSICKGSIDSTSLNRLKTLILKSCPRLKSLFPENMIQPLCCLQDLKVEDCSELKELIEVGSVVQTGVFSKLENMELNNLPKLVSICKGSIDSTSLNSLMTLTLKSCPKLKSIFPEHMIQPLCRLQDLKVEDCSELKEVIEVGSVVQTGAFSKLENMELNNLPKLVSICKGSIDSTSLNSLKTLTLKSCSKLNCLFPEHMIQPLCRLQYLKVEDCSELKEVIEVGSVVQTGAFSKLENMELSNLPKLVSICKGSKDSTSLNSLTTLTLKSCPKLNCLFPENMIQPLCHLQDLKVEDCSELKKLIEVGSIVQTGAFSKLKNMELINLPELFILFEDNSFEWLSFEVMKIKTCPKLKELPFSKENAPSLRIECTSQWWSNLNDSVKDRLRGLHRFV